MMGPPFMFFFPFVFLALFWGLPIYFVVRWAIRVRKALEEKNAAPAAFPGREELERLVASVDSLSDEVERLRERQDFVERLLQAPKAPGATPAVPPGAAPAGPAGNPPAAPRTTSPGPTPAGPCAPRCDTAAAPGCRWSR